MITASIYGVTVSPRNHQPPPDPHRTAQLAALASEIAERIEEMNELRLGSGTDLIMRLASVARADAGACALVLSVLHGQVEAILTSYAAQAEETGRKKQTMHYRTIAEIAAIRTIFPEVANELDRIRASVRHHEEPMSKADALRSGIDD